MSIKLNGQRQLSYDSDKRLLRVTLPIRFIKRGGKTKITTPEGQEVVTKAKKHPAPELRDALVRSHQWHQWLAEGKFRTVKELARHEGIKNKSYPYYIMGLFSLSPEIQESILTGEGAECIRPVHVIRQIEIPEAWSLQQAALLQEDK